MKSIPGFSRYVACESGLLYSTNYKNTGRLKELRPALSPDGYLKTMLVKDDGSYHTDRVHCFVAWAYLGPVPDGMEINHINGVKTDNSPSNLEYVTHSQNIKHAFDTGLATPARGELNGMAKLTDEEVAEIRRHARESPTRYYGRKLLAAKFKVSEAHIKDIVTKRRNLWPHIA